MVWPPLASVAKRAPRVPHSLGPLHAGLCAAAFTSVGWAAPIGDPPGDAPVLGDGWLGLAPGPLPAGLQEDGDPQLQQGGGPLGIDRRGGQISVGGGARSAESGDAVGWFGGDPTPGGVRLAGLLRLIGRFGDGDPFGASAGPAIEIPDAFIWGVSRYGPLDLRVELKGSTLGDDDSLVELGQLVADYRIDERHTLSVGRVTVPFSSAAYLREDRLMFPERSKWSQSFDVDDIGMVGRGRYGFMDLWVGVQNSPDGVGTSFRATGRADFWLYGTQTRPTELLYRAPLEEVLRLSLAYTDNGELDEAESYGLELEWRSRDWRLLAEVADNGADSGDNQPFSLTAQHAVVRNELEVAVRIEDRDDAFDTQSISVGATRYMLRDFALVQTAVDYVTANDNDQEGWVIRAGFVLGF
jgi:hypothetical protein